MNKGAVAQILLAHQAFNGLAASMTIPYLSIVGYREGPLNRAVL